MKVVFDTNIFVSALALPGSRAELALHRIIGGVDRLFISKPIIDELLGVLASKFSRDAEELARVAVFLTDIAEVVSPQHRVRVLDDEPDNRILECAVAAGADLLVSGDRAILQLAKFRDVRIISLRQYLER